MDNNDVIARRYTDEKYLSKTGLQQEMGTGLVDPFWNAIRAYRKDFEVDLPFRGIGRSPLHYVETTTIRERLSSFSKRLDLFLDKLANLLAGSDGRSIRSMLLYQCLKAIDIDGNFQMADRSIKALLSGTYDEDQPFHEPLINYHAYLRSLFSEGSGDLKSEDFLAHSYGIIRGEGDDLTEFYRNRELDSSVSKIRFLRDAVYPSAPLNEVDSLMGAFLPYVDSSDATPFVKAVFSLYFLTYVRPFDADYNGMMAALLFKKEYADGCKKPAAYYFPFERLLIAGASLEPNARSALSVGEGKKHAAYILGNYVMKKAASEGDLYLYQKSLISKALELLNAELPMQAVNERQVQRVLYQLALQHDLVVDGNRIYEYGFYEMERETAKMLVAHLLDKVPLYNVEKELEEAQKVLNIRLSEAQTKAVRMTFAHPVSIITGGPGTGKTTIINTIIPVFTTIELIGWSGKKIF